MLTALRALGAGLVQVARAWDAAALVWLLTTIVALPLTIVLGSHLEAALGRQPAIDLNSEEIDANWWREYRTHAVGIETTFTPAIIGVAAPLDLLSALADGVPPPLALVAPLVAYAVLWALLWGALLPRFQHAERQPMAKAWRSAVRHFPQFLGITVLASVAVLGLYFTIHRVLFGPVYGALAARAESEAWVFGGRLALYIVFALLLTSVSLVSDYARVWLVAGGGQTIKDALRGAAHFMRRHIAPVSLLWLLSTGVFVLVLVAYGIADQQFRGWRSVVLAQGFIVARLTVRLVAAAAQVELFRRAE